jgi:hypothetical protein
MGLSNEEIQALLNKSNKSPSSNKPATGGAKVSDRSKWDRPIQIGALKYSDETQPCTARGCTSPTLVRVYGVAKCSQHALYELNHAIITRLDFIPVQDCTCKAGFHTRYSIHTPDCSLYPELKERREYIPENSNNENETENGTEELL